MTDKSPTDSAKLQSDESISFEKISLLYTENAKVAAIFWEWRNKIMTYFFAAVAALFAFASWLYQHKLPGRFISVPLFIGFILAIASHLLDKRNAVILKRCYKVGGAIEEAWLKLPTGNWHDLDGAIFKFINQAHVRKRLTYTRTLQWTYLIIGALLFILSAANLYSPIENPRPAREADSAVEKVS